MSDVRYILNDNFPEILEHVDCQPAPTYLLKSMRTCYDRDGFFTETSLIVWMTDPLNKTKPYKDSNIRNYWRLAHTHRHNAQIPDINTFYSLLD